MEQRTTSAGYRFPLASRPRSSEYHQTCIPPEKKQQAAAVAAQAPQIGETSKCDAVKQDEIWKQSVRGETKRAKKWNDDWGFLTEFDSRGNHVDQGDPVEQKELPDKCNMFSENVPNTNAGNYGSRLNSDVGLTLQQMEFQFNSGNKKKKLGNEMVCY